MEHGLHEAISIRNNNVGPNTNVRRIQNLTEKSKRNGDILLLETANVLMLDVLATPERWAKQNATDHVFFEAMDTIRLEPNS